jgi:GNAT superfamily N-acetyltransferase
MLARSSSVTLPRNGRRTRAENERVPVMSLRGGRSLVPTPVGRVPGLREPIVGPYLVLEPVPRERVLAFLAGDFSTVRPGSGWPVPETTPGAPPWGVSIKHDVEVNWLVVLDGLVIGDCFTHGGADDAGDIEIGYALAEPYRRRGYGTELVKALSDWLFEHEGIERVVARNIVAANVASRRTLERVGFKLEREDGELVSYALERPRK